MCHTGDHVVFRIVAHEPKALFVLREMSRAFSVSARVSPVRWVDAVVHKEREDSATNKGYRVLTVSSYRLQT